MKVKTLFQRHRLESGGEATERIRFATALTPEELTQPAFDVSLLRRVVAPDGRDLTRVDLTASLGTFPAGGVNSFRDHREDGSGGIIGRRSVNELVGLVSAPRVQGEELRARYEFLPGGPAEHLRLVAEEVIRRRAAGRPTPNFGLSPDAMFAVQDGNLSHVAQWFSVDVVFDPATGAGFEELVREALQNQPQRPQVFDLAREPLARPPGLPPEPDLRQALANQQAQLDEIHLANLRVSVAGEAEVIQRDVEDWLSERQRLHVALPTPAETQAYAATRRERYGHSPVRHNGIVTASDAPDGMLRLHLAAADLFGIGREAFLRERNLPVPASVNALQVERLRFGLPELYVTLTGDDQGIGKFFPQRIRLANVTTTTFALFIQDALIVTIEDVLDDEALGLDWFEPIVYRQEADTIDDLNWVRLNAFDEAPTVAEGAAFTELAWDDVEETATFTKKGGYIGITLETLLKNRGSRIRQLAGGIASAARKAESNLVTSTFTTAAGAGPTMTETTRALMNTTDGNYGTTAFAVGEFWVASDAMSAFKAAGDASWNLGRMNRPNRLVVPWSLVQEANEVVNSVLRPQESGGATQSGNLQTVNVIRAVHPDLSVVENPEFSDATNWYAMSHRPPLHPAIVLYNLRGYRRPRVFVQDDESSGSMFTNDEIRFKLRHWVARLVTNWRSFYGEVVAG